MISQHWNVFVSQAPFHHNVTTPPLMAAFALLNGPARRNVSTKIDTLSKITPNYIHGNKSIARIQNAIPSTLVHRNVAMESVTDLRLAIRARRTVEVAVHIHHMIIFNAVYQMLQSVLNQKRFI
jgi:hypothetical protein